MPAIFCHSQMFGVFLLFLHCISFYCTVFHFIALYFILLHCNTVFHFLALHFEKIALLLGTDR
jgi:hypothetical protein